MEEDTDTKAVVDVGVRLERLDSMGCNIFWALLFGAVCISPLVVLVFTAAGAVSDLHNITKNMTKPRALAVEAVVVSVGAMLWIPVILGGLVLGAVAMRNAAEVRRKLRVAQEQQHYAITVADSKKGDETE